MSRKAMLAGLVSLVAASTAVAQAPAVPKPWKFGVQLGASVPNGDLSEIQGTGYNLGAHAGFKGPAIPVELRGELLYNSFAGKEIGGFGKTESFGLIGVGGSAAWSMPSGLYFIAGAGMYIPDCDGCDSKLGVNGGAGFSLPLSGFNWYAEARFHNVMTEGSATRFIPVSVGMRF